MKPLLIELTILACSGFVGSAASLQLKDLPAAVQKTGQEALKGGEIKRTSQECPFGLSVKTVEQPLD